MIGYDSPLYQSHTPRYYNSRGHTKIRDINEHSKPTTSDLRIDVRPSPPHQQRYQCESWNIGLP